MGCRGVAILPEGMSRERFEWLNRWTVDPDEDIIKTFGTESNVKEIYDACNELEKDPLNVILNQFSEFSNHMGHYAVTGPSLEKVFKHVTASKPGRLAAFVSASGSAGTLGAGDYLKDQLGSKIVAVELRTELTVDWIAPNRAARNSPRRPMGTSVWIRWT